MTQAAEPILIAHQHHPVGAAIAIGVARVLYKKGKLDSPAGQEPA